LNSTHHLQRVSDYEKPPKDTMGDLQPAPNQ
jgi:hypothetical protein